MKKNLFTLAALGLALGAFSITLPAQEVEPGFKSLFNGKDLTGWAGRPNHWSVQDGVITGITSSNNPAKGNNFLIAKDGDQNLIVGDFELRFPINLRGLGAIPGCNTAARTGGILW